MASVAPADVLRAVTGLRVSASRCWVRPCQFWPSAGPGLRLAQPLCRGRAARPGSQSPPGVLSSTATHARPRALYLPIHLLKDSSTAQSFGSYG